MSKQSPYEALYAASFPKDIVAHFDLVSVEFTEERVEVYLDEKDRPPVGYSIQELRRNGFTQGGLFSGPLTTYVLYQTLCQKCCQTQSRTMV